MRKSEKGDSEEEREGERGGMEMRALGRRDAPPTKPLRRGEDLGDAWVGEEGGERGATPATWVFDHHDRRRRNLHHECHAIGAHLVGAAGRRARHDGQGGGEREEAAVQRCRFRQH